MHKLSAPPRRRSPGPRAVLLYVAPWVTYAALFTAQQAATLRAYGAPVPLGRIVVETGAEATLWSLLAPLLAAVIARRSPSVRPLRRFVVPVAVAAALVVTVELAAWTVITRALPWTPPAAFTDDLVRIAGQSFAYALLVVLVMVSLLTAHALLTEARARQLAAARLEAETGRARLAALTSQLQPHFLFNALSTVGAVVHEDARGAERLLTALGDLLRRALSGGAAPLVTVAEELELLDRYVVVQLARFGDRLVVRRPALAALDAALRRQLVPCFVLQPLVENAIRHGLELHATPVTVEVALSRDGDALVLTVSDDGPGFDDGALLARSPEVLASEAPAGDVPGGVGLRNLAARLALLYRDAGSLSCTNRDEGGARVTVRLPCGPILVPA